MNKLKKITRKKDISEINCFGLDGDVDANNLKDLSIHVQFAVYLCNSERLEKFALWFDNIAKLNPTLLKDLMKNEEFSLCIVRLRLFQKKYQEVFHLLKTGPFSPKDDYIKLWEDAHYKEKEKAIGQTLTPLQRFRLRKKFPPPANICPYGRQIINPVFKQASLTLKKWFQEHLAFPYPNLNEKQMLAKQTGLTLYQVKTWFANTRRRKKVHQMRSSLSCYKLLNKNHFLIDSEQLVKESSEALDLSIQNLEKQVHQGNDRVNVKTEDPGFLLEQSVERTSAGLQGKFTKEQENEDGQRASKTSHKCCLYCPEFSEGPSTQMGYSTLESEPSSETINLPNRNPETESTYKQTSMNTTYSAEYIKDAELLNLLISKRKCQDVDLQKDEDDIKPYSPSEEPMKSMISQEPEVSYHILNTATYPPTAFPPFNFTRQQQVVTTTNSYDVVPMPPPSSSPFVTGFTSAVQTLPLSANPTIYSFPVLTAPMDPPGNFGSCVQDGSYLPSNQSPFKSSAMLNQGFQNTKFQENSGSYPQTTEQEPYITYMNSKSSCVKEYPLRPTPCRATETLAFAVSCPPFSMSNNNPTPLTKPATTNMNTHLQIIPTAVNLQAVRIKNEGWSQLPRSCDPLPSTSHETPTLGTSPQLPQSLHNIFGTKELLHLENEIAHTLLRLSRKENNNPVQYQDP